MNAIERLVAIEEIRQLKAKYFYAYDHKDWAMWRDEVWAPAGRLEVPEMNRNIGPREAMIEWVIAQAADQVSVHHGHTPIIDITSDTTATGIWAMEDKLWVVGESVVPYKFLHGYGHYHETYRKEADGWRIASVKLTRLRIDME